MCRSAEFVLPCRPESATVGRHHVADALAAWGVGGTDPAESALTDVLLVASELLGNAARACEGVMSVCIEGHRERVHIAVIDDSPVPAAPRVVDEAALSGRGLAIVIALAEQWGQTVHNGATKTVWADVAVPAGSVLAERCAL